MTRPTMTAGRPRRQVARLAIAALFLGAGAATAAPTTAPLRLFWPGSGRAAHTALLAVDTVTGESGGLFDVLRDQEFGDAFPQDRLLTCHVLAADAAEPGRQVELHMPSREMPILAPGQHIAVGYTADNKVVRITGVPLGLAPADEGTWLRAWVESP